MADLTGKIYTKFELSMFQFGTNEIFVCQLIRSSTFEIDEINKYISSINILSNLQIISRSGIYYILAKLLLSKTYCNHYCYI